MRIIEIIREVLPGIEHKVTFILIIASVVIQLCSLFDRYWFKGVVVHNFVTKFWIDWHLCRPRSFQGFSSRFDWRVKQQCPLSQSLQVSCWCLGFLSQKVRQVWRHNIEMCCCRADEIKRTIIICRFLRSLQWDIPFAISRPNASRDSFLPFALYFPTFSS